MHTLKHDLLDAGRRSTASVTRARESDTGTELPPRRRATPPFVVVSRQKHVATYVLSLRKDEEVVSTLLKFARDKRLVSGTLKAIGTVSQSQIDFFDPATNEYRQAAVPGRAEVASLIGGLGLADGQPFLYVRSVLRLRDGSARAGHLLKAHVSGALEVTLTAWSRPLPRTPEVATKLNWQCLAS